MKFLRSKSFWLTVAHIAVAGASIAGGIIFPGAAPIIVASQALINGIIPSPNKGVNDASKISSPTNSDGNSRTPTQQTIPPQQGTDQNVKGSVT